MERILTDKSHFVCYKYDLRKKSQSLHAKTRRRKGNAEKTFACSLSRERDVFACAFVFCCARRSCGLSKFGNRLKQLFSIFEIFFCVTLTVLTFPPKLTAQSGGPAGAYLQAGAGGRARGLGGAFVAIANDVTAGYWNPAGLGQLTEPQFAGMYSVLSLDRKYNYAAAAYPFGAAGAISVSWVNYQVGPIEGRDDEGVVTGKFSNAENALLISYGKAMPPALAFGATIKLLRHELAHRRASGLGYDFGVLFKPSEVFALGGSWQNLRTQIRWDDPNEQKETFLPRQRLGAQIKPATAFLVSVDYEMAAQRRGKLHVGGELFFGSFASLCLGNDDGEMTLGAAVLANSSRQNFSIEYGLRRDPVDQSFAHQFALLLKFNKPSRAVVNENGDLAESPLTASTTISKRQETESPSPLIASPAPPVRQEMAVPPQALFLVAQVIEVRPPFLIIGADDLTGLQSGITMRVYQFVFGKETGRDAEGRRQTAAEGRAVRRKMGEQKLRGNCRQFISL